MEFINSNNIVTFDLGTIPVVSKIIQLTCHIDAV